MQMRLLIEDLGNVGEVTAGALAADRFLRHVVERVLTQLVQLAVSVNSHVAAAEAGRSVTDYRASFDVMVEVGALTPGLAAQLKPSVGLRNIVVHEYVDVDLAVIAAAVPTARADYGRYVDELARWLADRAATSE